MMESIIAYGMLVFIFGGLTYLVIDMERTYKRIYKEDEEE